MKTTSDTAWQRRGTSWIWGEEARNSVCKASEIWSLRLFLRSTNHWPDVLPSNDQQTLVVGGLEGSLDILDPQQGEIWLDRTIKPAILSFQGNYQGEAALIFWMPHGNNRLDSHLSSDSVHWICEARHSQRKIDFGRILWGTTGEYPQRILIPNNARSNAGFFHARIT